ncbi:MAG: UDP-N-acetylmuramate--L-alanine ligase [Candidatus Omnitrophota bacterium]
MKKDIVIHFIGIGGAGMSGLAEVFHYNGFKVQGSDVKKTKITDRLEKLGISVKEGHYSDNIGEADYVVYSSCIEKQNVELKEAMIRRVKILRRIEALNMLMSDKKIIAISGTHGKTTTTSLVAYLLIKADLDPTVFVGADVGFLNGNARYGKGGLVVTEADESDGSFLLLNPLYSVTTNVDKEHMDYYVSMDNVIASYKRFIENTNEFGCALVCIDDDNLRFMAGSSSRRILTYGVSKDADIRAENIELLGLDGSRFDLVFKGKLLCNIKLSLIGSHNVLNSLAAIGIAIDLGIEISLIKEYIKDFKGANRRFNVTRLGSDILVIDDYAHHPTEIKATLKGLGDANKRIIAIFQPHRYSRTKYLKEEYGSSFALADHLIITDIYSAHESPLDNVTANDICESVKKSGHQNVHFMPKENIIKHLREIVKPSDAIFILGAGDIDELPEKIVKALEKESFKDAKV